MISGVTVMGQAAKCREFEDRLRTNGIHAKFGRQRGSTQTTVPTADSDPLAQLERLAALKERGLVTDEEFSAKKAALLDRI
jgi:Short C-terminal domain